MQRYNIAGTELIAEGLHVRPADGTYVDLEAFSLFKYGFVPPAKVYAGILAEKLAPMLWEVYGGRKVYIVSAPYKHLPTASHAIVQFLWLELSIGAFNLGIEPPAILPFTKAEAGDNSYATGSLADREKITQAMRLHVDEELVRGSNLLVVDDIQVTGAAKRRSAQYLEPLNPHSIWYLHAFSLSESSAMANPAIEDELNNTARHGAKAILRQYDQGEFRLNTRVLRHILEMKPTDFMDFIEAARVELLQDMYAAAIGTGKDYCRKHQDSLCKLHAELRARGVTFTS